MKKHCSTCLLWSGKHCKHNPTCEAGVLEHWVADRSNPDASDPINPPHYRLPGGFEVIQITRHLNLNRGSAVGYVLRAGRKTLVPGQEVEDLKKAVWHLQDEIQRLTGEGDHAKP